MPFVAAPGVTSVDLLWSLGTDVAENTFNYTGITHPVAAHQTFVDSISTEIKTIFQSMLSISAHLIGIYVRDLSTQHGESFDLAPSTPWAGTNASTELPYNVTIAVKRATGLAGRNQRGRIYFPVLCLNQMNSTNAINDTMASNLIGGWNGFMAWMLANHGATEVLLHRANGTSTPILEYSLRDQSVDSQRRRLPFHNRHH